MFCVWSLCCIFHCSCFIIFIKHWVQKGCSSHLTSGWGWETALFVGTHSSTHRSSLWKSLAVARDEDKDLLREDKASVTWHPNHSALPNSHSGGWLWITQLSEDEARQSQSRTWEVKAKHTKREGVVQLNKSVYLSQKVQGSDSSQPPCELHRPHSLLLPKREGLRIMRIQVKYDPCKPQTQADKEREGIPAIHRRVCEGPSCITSMLCVCLFYFACIFVIVLNFSLSYLLEGAESVSFPPSCLYP